MGFCSSFVISSIMNSREVFVSHSFHISQPQQARSAVTTFILQCFKQHCQVDGCQFKRLRKRKTFFQIKSLAHVLLCNVESLTSPDIQRRISKLKISYIAVDEAQVWFGLTLAVHKNLLLRKVADPETGWDFRPYSPVLWRWLRATYQGTPFMLSSATLNTESLERIKVSLGIEREEVKVLSSS